MAPEILAQVRDVAAEQVSWWRANQFCAREAMAALGYPVRWTTWKQVTAAAAREWLLLRASGAAGQYLGIPR